MAELREKTINILTDGFLVNRDQAEQAYDVMVKEMQPQWIKECEWEYEADFDENPAWGSSCGGVHCFIEGDIEENEYKFCPKCGGKIKEIDKYGSADVS